MERVKARKDTLKKGDAKWVEDLQAAGFDTYDGEAELVDRRLCESAARSWRRTAS